MTKELSLNWCPFVRAVLGDEPSCNCFISGEDADADEAADRRNPEWARCIEHECAMWRYYPDPIDDGYCGLAGKPAGVA